MLLLESTSRRGSGSGRFRLSRDMCERNVAEGMAWFTGGKASNGAIPGNMGPPLNMAMNEANDSSLRGAPNGGIPCNGELYWGMFCNDELY